MRARFSVPLFLLCHQLTTAKRTCYWPDGSVVARSLDYTPCNLTATGIDSACCASGDPCSANGYCFGTAGYVYRGGCTDINWDADECCPSCRNIAMDIFSNIIPCPSVNGSFTPKFCCSEKAGSQAAAAGCCDRAFDFRQQPIIAGLDRSEASTVSVVSPSKSAKQSTTTTASTPTRTLPISSSIPASTTSATSPIAAATSLSEHSALSKKNVNIAVAIGVSLGVSLISGLIIFLIHERRLRIKAQKEVMDTLAAYDRSRATRPPAGSHKMQRQSKPQELEDTQPQPGELYNGELYEADTRN